MHVLGTAYQDFIYKRSYSKFIEENKRREEWAETVGRYQDHFSTIIPESIHEDFKTAINHILDLSIMPSMRAMWTAGKALERESVCGYNCSYLIIDKPRRFSELMYILLCGGGVGFSVERQYIAGLWPVPEEFIDGDPIVIKDSKLGWAEGYQQFIKGLYNGKLRPVDYSKIRPAGARLKTFGGRASGPDPLKQLFDFTKQVFLLSRGRKLTSIECYDICCFIASIVVVGGVRRSATICLSNLSDQRMASAKTGEFWRQNPQRALSNISTAYTEKPDMISFMNEWMTLMKSGSGERGIVNRVGLKKLAAAAGRDPNAEYGVNPCGEIVMKPFQFCNLSEVVVKPEDDLVTLNNKVTGAALLGVLQSTQTDFKFLSDVWKKNCEDERLLGISLTGLRDHPVLKTNNLNARNWLDSMKKTARQAANMYADALGINRPKAITCVKPSGTVSQLVSCSSGLHTRYAPYYIRRVRVSVTDPVAQFLSDSGVPWEPEVGQDEKSCTTLVFEFPVKSPDASVCKGDVDAVEQLEYFMMLQEHWCDHKPSCTIYVKPNEWLEVGAWVYKNWDVVSGISFMPDDGGVYQLAPYEVITKDKYDSLVASMPELNFLKLNEYEMSDMTIGGHEVACSGGQCEL